MILSPETRAQWYGDPTINNAVCIAPKMQSAPVVCTDGSGGAIIAWEDTRGTSKDIYAQHFNSYGAPQWTQNGVLICGAPGDVQNLVIFSDGSGGAFLIWADIRAGAGEHDIYAQRINSSGTSLWTANGVPVCTARWRQRWISAHPDGTGGIFIAWQDERGNDFDIYAQRINGSGAALWTADGIPVCTATDVQKYPKLCPDGSGGIIIAWSDERGVESDIYAQRISGSGTVQWTANGIPVSTAPEHQWIAEICDDGSGGALIVWTDRRYISTNGTDIYAQRIDGSGSSLWAASGIPICAASGDQAGARVHGDGIGGMFIIFHENGTGLIAQRVNPSGTLLWSTNGVRVCTASGGQADHRFCNDGSGGIIITWQDGRGDWDIYAQRISGNGSIQWAATGTPVCTATGFQDNPSICADGSGGAIIAWWDDRGSTIDIYASAIRSSGSLVPVELSAFSATAAAGNVVLRWETVAELNNRGFEIQRRSETDGVWQKIGFVDGRGNGNTGGTYAFTDRQSGEVKPHPLLFYRLRQIDFDGSFTYSPVVRVEAVGRTQATILLDPYPNPGTAYVFIPFTLTHERPLTIRFCNMAGRMVLSVCESAVFAGGSHALMVPTARLAPGTYFVTLSTGLWRQTKKVTIVR